MMRNRRAALQTLWAASLPLLAGRGLAQDDKSPITIVIGIGASMDVVGRLIADQLRETLGRPAVVLNKPGAGQRLALGEVRHAAPDGRTLLFATSGPFAIYPNIYTGLDYDPATDFTPIGGISSFDVGIAASLQSGITTLAQWIEWTRTQPKGDVVFGSAPGNGSLSHFVGLSLGLASKVGMTHVPYKDSGTGVIDVSTGRLPLMITGVNAFVELHKAGKLRVLAVSGAQRTAQLPEVPTLKEAGIDVASSTTTGVFGPPKMGPELARRLHDAIVPMLDRPEVRERIAAQTMTVWPATGAQLAASLADERRHFAALVKASGYVPEPL